MMFLSISGVTARLHVVGFRGVEAISAPYKFEVEVVTRSSSLGRNVGRSAVLTWTVDDREAHRHGILAGVAVVGVIGTQMRYRLTIVPAISQLDSRANCRVFQEVTVDHVLTALLGEHNVDSYRMERSDTPSPRPYLVQYRETDLDFFQRLLEEEGLFYFFEHTQDDHTLVVTDDAAKYGRTPGGSLRFRSGATDVEAVSDFTFSNVAVAERVRLRDYNSDTPSADLEVVRQAPRTAGSSEIYDYPGGYGDLATGRVRARLRLDSARVPALTAAAVSNSPRLTPGYTFRLAEHRYRPANRTYVTVKITHVATREQDSGSLQYQNNAECVGAKVPYRSAGRCPSLVMSGPQTATVVGPAGEEIHVDEHGRVKVQFHWDREGQADEHSSAWIRVVQVIAGKGWGSLTIPRIGHEVLVDFVNGDPSRPVIVGGLYNGVNVPPSSLPDHKTHTVMRTQTSPGGDGHNELLFDDAAGQEKVSLRAQKDHTLVVVNNSNQSIGNDTSLEVGHNSTQSVDNDLTLTVGNGFSVNIGGDAVQQVGHDSTRFVGNSLGLTVGNGVSVDIGGDSAESVGRNLDLTVGRDLAMETGRALTVRVGGAQSVQTGSDYQHTIGKAYTCTVGDKATLQAQAVQINAADELRLKVGRASIVMKKDGDIAITGRNIDVKASGKLTMKGSNIS